MKRSQFMIGVLLALLLLVTQVAAVGAAPPAQEALPIEGTIENITIDDTNSEAITVDVTLSFTNGDPDQTFTLSLETAKTKGLVIDDGTGGYSVDLLKYGEKLSLDPAVDLLEDQEQEKEHPVGFALSEFFGDLFGVDYEAVMDYHDDGFGFGVIAQALWMTKALDGDDAMFGEILDAKRSGDYSLFFDDENDVPQNWGQFRKAVMNDRDKSKENLGAIMSGRAEKDGDEGNFSQKNNGNAPGQDKNKNKSKGKGHNK